MADKRAPGLVAELPRLNVVGASPLGITGDSRHRYGYHIPSSRVDPADYSMRGAANRPVGDFACAIDIGMTTWPASRRWLAWLIGEIRADRITGVAEVIGSLDGRNVRYWSDGAGWSPGGVRYQGTGHDTWTHVGIYRSTARTDHRLLAGWAANGFTEGDDDLDAKQSAQLESVAGRLGEMYSSWYHGGSPKSRADVDKKLVALDAKVDRQLAATAALTVQLAALVEQLRAQCGG